MSKCEMDFMCKSSISFVNFRCLMYLDNFNCPLQIYSRINATDLGIGTCPLYSGITSGFTSSNVQGNICISGDWNNVNYMQRKWLNPFAIFWPFLIIVIIVINNALISKVQGILITSPPTFSVTQVSLTLHTSLPYKLIKLHTVCMLILLLTLMILLYIFFHSYRIEIPIQWHFFGQFHHFIACLPLHYTPTAFIPSHYYFFNPEPKFDSIWYLHFPVFLLCKMQISENM